MEWQQIIDKILMEDNKKIIQPKDLLGTSNFATEKDLQSSVINPNAPTLSGALSYGAYESGNFEKDYGKYGVLNNPISRPNWDDTRAIMQPLGEKIGRGAIKFVGNTAINVVGGLSSLAWGTVDAAISQNAAKIVDNDLSRGLTNLQEQLGDAFPHYYSKAEQEAGFWGKVTTANFLTDQLTNGLSFIAGAIITEGIASAATAASGGALSGLLAMNSVRLAAQTKRMFKGLDTASDIASMTRNAVNVRRNLSTAGTFARQLYTGAGWEGTVEALDFVKRSEQEFLENYRRNNYGEDPSVEELAKFKDHIAGYQNDVLLWNMGLVSFGNFVSLPKTFNYGVKNRSNKYFGLTNPIKSELKDGVRSYRNIYNDWGKTKKALYHTKNLVKRPLAEGVIEEGGQGVIKNAFTDYAISTYDPKNIEATVDWVDSLSGAVKEQLGSTDGQVEMFLGALLGGMGMAHYGVKKDSAGNVIKNSDGTVKRGFGWEGGVIGAYREGVTAVKENDQLVDKLTSSEETIKRILKPFKLVSNSMDANSNEGGSFVDNNINEAYFSEKRDFYNYAVARIEAGLASEISDDIANQVKSMPIEEFKTTFNYEGDLSTSELESRRQETIESIQKESKRAIKSFGVAKSFAEFYKYPDSIQDDLIMAYGYALYESDLNDKVELDISNKISELVGGVKSAESIVKYNQLNEELAGKQAELKALKKNYETIRNASQLSYGKDALDNIDKAEDVLNQIAEANKAINDINKRMFDTNKSSRYAGDFDTFVSDIQNAINTDEFLREKIAKDPVIADELKSLISDLGKVSNRRYGTIAAFDLIRTPEKLAGFVEDLVGFKEEAIKAILGEDGFNEYKGVTKEATNQMPQTNDSVLSILNEAVEDKPEAVKELVSKIEELKREFSKTKTADGNVYVHNFVLEGFGPSSTRYTSKSAIVGSTFNSTEETEAKFAHNKNTGDAIDLVVKELFVNGTFTKPDNNILSNDQLDQIKEATLALKTQLEEAGYVKFYSDVIFHSNKGNPDYASYAAGETDLIAIRKDGSFIIIDVKAMSKSVNSNKFNTVWQGTDKNNVAINRSNKDQYTIDQSFYSVLANHSVGKSPNGLFLFNIEVTFDDSKTVEEVNPEPLYELPFNQTSTGETVDRFFRDNVIPVNNTAAKRYGLISPDDFINALLISPTNPNTSEVYENSQNVTKEDLIANGQLEIVNFEAEGDAYYPTPEFEEAGLKLGKNKFAVYINVNGIRVGLLKDPRRYLDKAGNVQNFGDPEVLRKFTNPNYVSEEVLQQMVSEFKNQVYLFRKLDALIKDVPARESKILTREELNNSIDFDLKMRFSSPKAGEDRKSVTESIEPIGVQVGKNQVTGVVIIDKLKNKYSLNEINGSINNRSNVGKIIESTLLAREGVSKIEQVNAFNRYYAIGQTNTGPMLFRLAFKKATEELKDEFLADVKQLAVDPLFKLTQKYLILTSSIKYDSDTAIDMNIGFNKETQKIFIEAIAVSTSPTGESVKTKIPTTGIDASILKDINSYDQLIDLFNAQLASSARFNQVVGTTGAKISNIVLKKENYNVEDFDSNTNIVRYTPIVKVVNNTTKAPAQSVSNANKVINEEVAPTIKEDSQDVPPIEANLVGAVSLSSMLSNMGVAIDDAALESITKPKEDSQDVPIDSKSKTEGTNLQNMGQAAASIGNALVDKLIQDVKKGNYFSNKKEVIDELLQDVRLQGYKSIPTSKKFGKNTVQGYTIVKKESTTQSDIEAKKADIEKTLYPTISGSTTLTDALPDGIYIDLGNGFFAFADKKAKIAAIVDKNNNSSVSKSFWNDSKKEWQLPNKANLEDDAKRFNDVNYINKIQKATDSLNTQSKIETKTADIERRREEELRANPTMNSLIKVGNTINYNGNKVTILEIKRQADGGGLVIGENVGVLNIDLKDNDSYILYQNGKKSEKEINAKYDAEIKALEDSSKSIGNVIQEASEPQPLESAEVNELSELNTKASELRVKIKELRKSKANITEIAKANEELVNIQNNIAKLSNNGNNIGTMQSDEAREEAFEIASLELQRMLNITPSRMNNLISKFGSNPRLVGAVYRGAVYLADMMPKGTAYHEAFHYVFRTFLTDKEINKIINYAKSKYPKPTAKQLADLKTSQARYSTLNVNQLVDLYYEELLAEAFRSYSNNRKPLNKLNWLQKFWQSILDFIGVFKNKNTDIELLFKNIYDGKFLNAKHKYNVFTSASTLAPMLLDRIHDSGTGELTVSKFDTNESEAISNTILAQTVSMLNSLTEEQRAELSVKGVINMAYMDFIETYNIDNYMDMFESMEEGKADEFYEYMTEYYNSLMLDSNVIAINEDVARKLKMFIGVKDIVEDDNEIPERNYDLSPENISGFSNLNHKTRVYLSTTTYDKTDEFGITRKQAVDGFRLYETLSRALANTTKSKIFFKLQKFAKLNEEAMHFYNRLANDVEYTDGMTHSQLSLSPIYNMTMNAFNNYKVRVTQVLNDYNKNLVFDSNVKGVDFMQVKSWNANFEYKNKKLSPTERANKFNSLVDIFQSYADMEVPEGVNFETAVISEIKSNITNATNILKDNIGMPLSKGYIQYSVLKSNEALLLELKDSSELTDYESEFINDALSILSLYSDIYALTGDEIKSLQLEISRNKNIFKNDDDGAFTRLKRIARANSVFDSTIGTSIYLNAAGKPVTDVIKGNLIIERFEQLKSEKRYKLENFFNERNQPSIENFRNAFPEFDAKDSEVFFNYLQDNLLINSEHADLIFSEQSLIGLLDGTRQTTWEAEGDDFRETNNADEREGSVFADQDSRGKLHTLLTLFAKQKAVKSFKNGVKKDVMFAEFNMGVNETAKTTYTFSAPVKNYAITELDKAIANGVSQEELAKIKPLKGVNSIIEDHYKLLTKEIHRIKRETIALETADSFSEDNPKIRQYHYDNKGKTPTGLDLFHYKQWMQEYDQALYKKVIENPDDYINGVNKAELYKFLIEVAKKQVLDVEQLIKSNDINLLEKSANGKSLIDNYYLDKDRNLDLNSLSQAVWNHYTNVVSFNELLYGDVAYSKKDATDVNKRKKTAAGTKNNFGESYSYAEIFRFDPAEDRILNGKTIAGIDHTDAQSWGSPFWKVHQLIELGNYTSEVKNIYENKIIKGKELTRKEVEILMANGANLNPDKNLYEDGATSLKMSQFTLTRNLTSKLKPGANREALDLLYDELILTYYQYKQDLISREEYVELSTDIYSEIHTYWEPSDLDDGMHAMLNDFELKSLDYRTADSGSKGVFKEGIRRMDNRRMGKQMETDGYKTNIVHGTQLLSIIWSEQELNDIVNFGKNSATLEQVSEHFDELLAERIHNSFIEKRKHLVDSLGKPKFDVLVEAFKSSLSGMKINPFMSEMFDYDTTATGQIKPNYNHNSLPVVKKFEAMFLNFLSDGVLKQKTAGSKLTLVSPYGFKDLKHRLYDPETGYYYSECYVSAYYLNKYGLKPGDNIPKELLEIFGIRIPTQDKHSMMSLRVKGFMPAEYGVAGVFPPEIVYLSGADFDIDALYASNKAFFKNSNGEIVKYGSYINSENPIDSAFEEYINELMSNDKGFKSIYKTFSKETAYEYEEDGYLSKFDIKLANNQLYLAQTIKKVFGKDFSQFKTDFETKYGKQIQKNIDALTKTTGDNNLLTEFKNYKPITNSELNNRLIDYEFRLLHNNSNEEIAATPATTEKLKSIFKFFQNELDYEDNSAIANAFDMSDMVKAYKANADGQANIGPAALFNKAFQNLVKANAVLREGISPIEYYRKDSNELSEINGFTSFELEFDGEVHRINDLISTIISAMTDNVKDPIAGKLNLNLEVLPSALAMVGMGMSLREAVLIVNQPEVIEIVSKYKIKNSSIILPKEQYLNFEKLYDDKIKSLETALNKIVEKFPELDAIDIYDSNYAPSYEGLMSNIKKSKDEIFKGIKLDEINSETAREYFEHISGKIRNIEMFNQFRTIGNELQGLTKLIGLDKGTGATFGSLRDYDLAMRTLGVRYNAATGKVENTDAIRYFDYANIINESKYLSQLISTMLQNREIAAIFAIQEAKPFRTMVEKVFGSLKEINYNAEEIYDRVNKDLLSFLSMKAMSISEQWYTDYSYNTFTDGENNFANFIQAIKSEPTVIDSEGNEIENPFIDNYFLKFVDVVEVNGVKQIQSNTWTTQSDKFVRDLINGYESIANNKQKVSFKINDKLVEFNGNKFVKMTFTYLSVKDGLQYRSNTILQHLPPAIYKANSRALDTVQELFAGLSNNKMTEEQRNELDLKTRATLGASINELTVEFTKRAMKQAAMQKHINYASQGVAAANITSPLGKEYNSVQNFKDANQNSNWIFQPKYGSGGLDLTVARMNKIAKNIPGVKIYTFSGTSKAGKDYEIVKLGYPVVFKGRGESYFELIEAYNVNDRDNTETVIDIANGLNSAGKLIADKVVYRITRKYSNDTVKPFGIFDYDKQMEILNKLADKKTKKPLTEANATMDSPSPSEEDFSNDAPQGAEVEAMIMATAVSMDSIFGQMPEGVVEPVIPVKDEQKTINVYLGQAESSTSTKILSNLAPRKFKYKSTDGITREYGSVEHAYQSNKNGKFDKTTYDNYSKQNLNPTNILEENRLNYKNYVLKNIGIIKKIEVIDNNGFKVTFENNEVTELYPKQGQFSNLAKYTKESGADLKIFAGISKIIEESGIAGYGVKISPKLTEVGRRGNLQLMKDLVVESFVQNPGSEAAKKLLQYDNFTHNTNELIDKAFLEGLQLSRQELLSLKNTKKTTPATLKTLKSLYDAYNKKYGNDKVKGGDLSSSTVEFLTSEGVFRELDNQTRLDGINFIYNGFKEAQPDLTIEQISLDIINSLETSLDSIVTSIKGLKESNCI